MDQGPLGPSTSPGSCCLTWWRNQIFTLRALLDHYCSLCFSFSLYLYFCKMWCLLSPICLLLIILCGLPGHHSERTLMITYLSWMQNIQVIQLFESLVHICLVNMYWWREAWKLTGARPYLIVTAYKLHLLTHNKETPNCCNQCGRHFSNQGSYGTHLCNHSAPYKCDCCGKSFGYLCHYKRHLLVHTGEKPYKCD